MNRINKLVKIALLLAIAVVLNYIESLIPLPLPVPGIKLGIANFVGLIVLFMFGSKDFVFFNVLKVLLVAILRFGFGTSFFISFSGMFFSTIITLILYNYTKSSIFGLSVMSAVFHSLGQVLMVCLLYNTIYMINYLPILTFTSSISGFLTSMLAAMVLKRLPDNKIKMT